MKQIPKSIYSLILVLVVVFLLQIAPHATAAQLGSAENIEDSLNDSVILYNQSPKALINNTASYINKNDLSVKPVIENGRFLVPVNFILETLKAKNIKSTDSSVIKMNLEGINIQINSDLKEAIIDNYGINQIIPLRLINNSLYAPIRDLAKTLNKDLFVYNGLIILSDSKNIFNIRNAEYLVKEFISRIKADQLAIPVLTYHHFQYYISNPHTATIMTPDEFEENMKYLKENGYNTIFFSDLYDYVTFGEPLPPNPIIITMDDGYSSNYTYAFPILKKYDMKATIFMVTDFAGKNLKNYPHFNWEQAKEMQESGFIDIQNHTNKHDFLSKMSEEDIINSVVTAQDLIDSNVGKKNVNVLAYPGGNYNDFTRNLLFKLGFKLQATGQNQLIGKNTNLTDIHRINIHHGLTGKDIVRIIKDLKLRL